ncbi:MAG: ABC transporter permease, partial [Christensenellales bacterium]
MINDMRPMREPLLQISRRDSIDWWKAWLIRLVAILLALCACAVIIYALTRLNPIEVYKGIVAGAIGTTKRSWVTIRDTATLLCISIALAPAFKMRFWNIGAEGQVLVGGLATAAVMIHFGAMPTWLLFATMAVAS